MDKNQHPINNIIWRNRDELWSNDYNPNHVAPPELELLKTSILEDGWAMPILIRPDGEIVDGFHRWTLSDTAELRARDKGMVPTAELPKAETRAHQIGSTIRYNRARGSHFLGSMSDIVVDLKDNQKLSDEQIKEQLGMEQEEIERLYDRGKMSIRGSSDGFNKGWTGT